MYLSQLHRHMSAQNSFSHDGEHKGQKLIYVNRHDDICDNVLIKLSQYSGKDLDRRENINSNYKIGKLSGALSRIGYSTN